MGDWIAGTSANPEEVEAGAGAEAGVRAEEVAPEESAATGDEGEEAMAAGLEAPVEILEQMMQVRDGAVEQWQR